MCDCRIGYALNSDGRTCRGKIDEINVHDQTACLINFELLSQTLMSVTLELTAVTKIATTTLDRIHAAVMQAGVSTLMDSAAMVL